MSALRTFALTALIAASSFTWSTAALAEDSPPAPPPSPAKGTPSKPPDEEMGESVKAFAAAEEGRKLLSAALNPEGVIVEQVLLGEHRFNGEYEEVIRQKKLAEQTAEKAKSEGQKGCRRLTKRALVTAN